MLSASGLTLLAVLGVAIPAGASMILRGVIPPMSGLPRGSLVRDPYYGLDSAAKESAIMNQKLERWLKLVRLTPADATVLEAVIFDMRDWDMTPRQAKRVIAYEGAPQSLTDEIVQHKVGWPNIDQDEHIDTGWRWERILEGRIALAREDAPPPG
jgi:hypothetical protein